MSSKRHIELIHGEIDGTNRPTESAELNKVIERDANARKYQADMKQLTEMLDRVENEEVPQDLRDSIRSTIASRSNSAPLPLHEDPTRSFTRAPAFRLSMALAAGVVLGLIVGPLVFNQSRDWDPSNFVGAIGSRITDPVELDGDRFSSTIRAVQNDDRLLVTFDVSAQAPVEVTLEYDPGKIALTGFARRGGQFDVVEARDGRFIIHGDNDFRGNLMLERTDPATTTLRLRARRNGAELGEELLNLD